MRLTGRLMAIFIWLLGAMMPGCSTAPPSSVAEGWLGEAGGAVTPTPLMRELALSTGFGASDAALGRNDATQGRLAGTAIWFHEAALISIDADQHSHFGRVHDHARVRTRVHRVPVAE